MKKIVIGVIVLVILLAGAYFALTMKQGTAPGASSLKDATYTVDGQPVTLGSGTATYFGNEATGDLNGDGMPDTAFIFTQSPGGSGTFYYAAVALKTDTGYTGTNAILLGDRISPQTTEIADGEAVVNYADRKPEDPMTTAPSVGVSKYLKVENGQLVEVADPNAPTSQYVPGNLLLGADATSTLGKYLIGYNGMTLYKYTKDTANTSNCSGQCAVNWPPYTVASTDALQNIQAGITGTVGSISRADGTTQVTYNGMPLYFWISDKAPGDTTGQNVGGVWFVVKP